jgi:hypothetical protein
MLKTNMSAKGGSASGGKKIILLIIVIAVILSADIFLYTKLFSRGGDLNNNEINAPISDCIDDEDCKIIYSSCSCEAVPIIDPRTQIDNAGLPVCEVNQCPADQARCVENKCVLPGITPRTPLTCGNKYLSENGLRLDIGNAEDKAIIDRFRTGKCLDGSSPEQIIYKGYNIEKGCVDCLDQEIIYNCQTENKFILERGVGIGGVEYRIFEGDPCADQNTLTAALLSAQINNNSDLAESSAPEIPLPGNIISGQIMKYFKLGNIYLALILQPSMNVWLPDVPANYTASFAGVLAAREDDQAWTKLLELKDQAQTDKNNPYYLWLKDNKIFLSVVDQNGAGSGEGMMKVLTLNDKNLWVIDGCYYFNGNFTDGDYFMFSQRLDKAEPRPLSDCNNLQWSE